MNTSSLLAQKKTHELYNCDAALTKHKVDMDGLFDALKNLCSTIDLKCRAYPNRGDLCQDSIHAAQNLFTQLDTISRLHCRETEIDFNQGNVLLKDRIHDENRKLREKMMNKIRHRRKKRKAVALLNATNAAEDEQCDVPAYKEMCLTKKEIEALTSNLESCTCVQSPLLHRQCMACYAQDPTMSGFNTANAYFKALFENNQCPVVNTKIKSILQQKNAVTKVETVIGCMFYSALNIEISIPRKLHDSVRKDDVPNMACILKNFASLNGSLRELGLQNALDSDLDLDKFLVCVGKWIKTRTQLERTGLENSLKQLSILFQEVQRSLYENDNGFYCGKEPGEVCEVEALCLAAKQSDMPVVIVFDYHTGKIECVTGKTWPVDLKLVHQVLQPHLREMPFVNFKKLMTEDTTSTQFKLNRFWEGSVDNLLSSANTLEVSGNVAADVIRFVNSYRIVLAYGYALILKPVWERLNAVLTNTNQFSSKCKQTLMKLQASMCVGMDFGHSVMIILNSCKEDSSQVVRWTVNVAKKCACLLGKLTRCIITAKPDPAQDCLYVSRSFAKNISYGIQKSQLSTANDAELDQADFELRLTMCVKESIQSANNAAEPRQLCCLIQLSDFVNPLVGILLAFIPPWQDVTYGIPGSFPTRSVATTQGNPQHIGILQDDNLLLSTNHVSPDIRAHRGAGVSIDCIAFGAGSIVKYQVTPFMSIRAQITEIHFDVPSGAMMLEFDSSQASISTLITHHLGTTTYHTNFMAAFVLGVGTRLARVVDLGDMARTLKVADYKLLEQNVFSSKTKLTSRIGPYEKIKFVMISHQKGDQIVTENVYDLGKISPAFM